MREYKKYEYCVVDESQDFSLLEYLILNKIVLRGRFALFGDLNQSLENDGVRNWDDIKSVITDARVANKFSLEENYRSTKQIIDYANNILKPYTDKYLPKSIDRVGEEPGEILFLNEDEMLEEFRNSLSNDLKDIHKSIGVIVFENNDFTVEKVKEIMLKENIDKNENGFIKLTSNQKINYTPLGIYLMKSDDCKGLEFSKVYVLNLNTKKIKNYSDARKAFVSVTRAMNELQVFGVK
jgi:DNA helicase-2/ATP-dependent DNA helicase PcrA